MTITTSDREAFIAMASKSAGQIFDEIMKGEPKSEVHMRMMTTDSDYNATPETMNMIWKFKP